MRRSFPPKPRFLVTLAVALLMLGLTACSNPGPPEKKTTKTPSKPKPNIEVSLKSHVELKEQVAGYAGKVVVVDIWALW